MARQPNPVPGIGQQRQQFAPRQMQPIESLLGHPMRQPAGDQGIAEQMHELSMEIYARIAADHIADDHYTHPLSVEHLHQLASHSQLAARCYFEALGIKFDEQPGVS